MLKCRHAHLAKTRHQYRNVSAYGRLCNLTGAAPLETDLEGYTNDMLYEESSLQTDLFRCLLYENVQNPIFSPWTPDSGGGPPALWETAGHIYESGWRPENAAFLQATLTTELIKSKLRYAVHAVENVANSDVPQQMLDDFEV